MGHCLIVGIQVAIPKQSSFFCLRRLETGSPDTFLQYYKFLSIGLLEWSLVDIPIVLYADIMCNHSISLSKQSSLDD